MEYPLAIVRGKITRATADKLLVDGADWGSDCLKGYLVSIVEGTGKGQIRTISTNSIDSITPTTDFTTVPDETSVFCVLGAIRA